MSEDSELLETPLHGEHVALGGKMVPFAGFDMPVQYPHGITKEHRAVRERVGLFDVSHMGEFRVTGPQALDLIQKVAVNDASRLEVGQAQYSALCQEDGGVLDDLLIYRKAKEWMVVVNASNRDADLQWILKHAQGMDVTVEDQSDSIALLALQGPSSAQVAARLTDYPLDEIGYYRFAEGNIAGVPAILARTGYTGEDGFEFYVASRDAVTLWRALLAAGEADGIIPCGLGARDSLRLEVGYPLYGNDLSTEYTALESGLGWIVKLDKGDFVGRNALARQKEAGVTRRLVGMVLETRGFPRAGYPVVDDEGQEVGQVTSGVLSPTLGEGIALGYVPVALAAPDSQLGVRIRSDDIPARVTRPPFYKAGSIKR